MPYVIRHPSGQYVQEWFRAVGTATASRVELVPKAQASSYYSLREAREIARAWFPTEEMEVEPR